jgi:hypothetical protein
MDNILPIVAIAIIINWVIIHYIIASATRSKEQVRMLRAQFGILVQIAKANGVTDEKIKEINDQANKF